MIGEFLAKKNKFICLLTSPLCHALQHEIINLIYLVIYIWYNYNMLVYSVRMQYNIMIYTCYY